jgi:hypothetical protein
MPMEKPGIQITLIRTSPTVTATRQDLRQIGGYFARPGSKGSAERDRLSRWTPADRNS